MTNNEKDIISALVNGKTINIRLKSGCVLKNVSGTEFANALTDSLDPNNHFNVCNAVAFCAVTLMNDCLSINGLARGDLPKDDFQMFVLLYTEYTLGMTSAMNHGSTVNYFHYTELFCEKLYELCYEYLEKGYCSYHKI